MSPLMNSQVCPVVVMDGVFVRGAVEFHTLSKTSNVRIFRFLI